jgi:pimeloyl-ACP methyl ester carboxylesterase
LAPGLAWAALVHPAFASEKGSDHRKGSHLSSPVEDNRRDPFAGDIRKTLNFRDRRGTDLTISYLDTGGSDNTAIVLIHGFGASAYTWHALLHSLAEHHRVVAIDLKGFGQSGKPDDQYYSIFDQAEVVDTLIRHLDLREIVLGGHSMGGTIALVLASGPPEERPYRIERLMIFSAPAFRQRLPLFIMALDIPLLGEAVLHIIPPETVVRFVLEASYYDDDLIGDREVAAYARGLKSPGGRKALTTTAGCLADLNASGFTFDFRAVKMPALLVWGRHDTVVPTGYAFALRDALPGPVSFHRLPECGHIPPTEKPHATLRLISEFLTLKTGSDLEN